MKCTVSLCILCYVDIVGSGEFFQPRLQCKSAREIFLLLLCYGNVELYVVICEKIYILPNTITVMYSSPNIRILYVDPIYYVRR